MSLNTFSNFLANFPITGKSGAIFSVASSPAQGGNTAQINRNGVAYHSILYVVNGQGGSGDDANPSGAQIQVSTPQLVGGVNQPAYPGAVALAADAAQYILSLSLS